MGVKKIIAGALAGLLALSAIGIAGCKNTEPTTPSTEPPEGTVDYGYTEGKIGDFKQYIGTDKYRVVTTADELVTAIADAKCHYTNVWDEATGTYSQVPADGYTQDDFKGKVNVIEIANDVNLGYEKLSAESKANTSIVEDFTRRQTNQKTQFTMSDMFIENGISQIKVENTSDLLVYSKNGAKLTHGGFKLTSDDNVVFRNLEFDEMWQWEDAPTKTVGAVGDYDAFGWAYFKIAFCGYILIDHCTFGKSYDGQIDYSNPDYTANAGVAFRAPYGADGGNGLHINYCKFNAGSDDENGYLYKMMEKIEENYQANKADSSVACKYLYYKALRDADVSFEDILYGIAIPQKKGFLCGDDAKNTEPDYTYNLKLQVSFANSIFTNIEDRLPKLRGGNAVMYNCVVDSSQYYTYRTKLSNAGAASAVTGVNSSWKCALVSQGIVCGNCGSVYAENCIFKGIKDLIKHNDKKNSSPYVDGGYKLINCTYRKSTGTLPISGSTTDAVNPFALFDSVKLNISNFSWHTPDGEQPFLPNLIDIEELIGKLNGQNGAGCYIHSSVR